MTYETPVLATVDEAANLVLGGLHEDGDSGQIPPTMGEGLLGLDE